MDKGANELTHYLFDDFCRGEACNMRRIILFSPMSACARKRRIKELLDLEFPLEMPEAKSLWRRAPNGGLIC